MYITKNTNGTLQVGSKPRAGAVSVTELPTAPKFLLWNDADPVNPIIDEAKIFMSKATALTTAVEETLDAKAQEFRYDDIKSARSYTGYLNAYQAEATTLAVWASECWSYMDTLEANLLNTKEVVVDTVTTIEPDPIKTEIAWVDFMPTVDELLASLPVYVGVV